MTTQNSLPLPEAVEAWRYSFDTPEEMRSVVQRLASQLQTHVDTGTSTPPELVGRYLRACNRLAQVEL